MDAESFNARLTRVEEQIKSGCVIRGGEPAQEQPREEEETPPAPDDADAPPAPEDEPAAVQEAPMVFWTELVSAVRGELKPMCRGFFVSAPDGPIQGILKGDVLTLRCETAYVVDIINKPDILEVVSRKASALLNKRISVRVEDRSAKPAASAGMAKLKAYGQAHRDVVKITE